MRSALSLIALVALTSACASTPERPIANSRASVAIPDPAFRAPDVMRGADVDNLIGQPASSLGERFGMPRIDFVEGDARKLQFTSEACVLDIYLYPMSAGAAPVATHIEARQRQGGKAIERADCIAEVERAR